MKEKVSKCVYCGKRPTIIHLPGDLYYAQCTYNKQGAYDYLGATEKQCIDVWNKGQYSLSQYQKGGENDIC